MLEGLASSRIGMRMALGVGRAVPKRAADRVVGALARRMASDTGSELVRASRVNQFVVSGGTLSGEALEQTVRENVLSMARSLYDLYHVLGDDDAEESLVVRDAEFVKFVERESSSGPYVYVGVHLGNFDLLGRVLGRAGWTMQVLSVPDPTGGYQWQNDMREQVGFEVTPVSLESLKAAARRLEAGGSVLTGLDRPLDEPDKVQPRFFGRPCALPLLHVRLAMRAGVPVIPFTAPRTPDGHYRLLSTDPIPMVGDRSSPEALLANAERCLAPAERWIAEYPSQWAMPHVVWPDVSLPADEEHAE
ncbi:MAG: lysophospholipid acyltransferase family protein [Coriobacteriia bacterium]|nr:lysophospholipid acyltransferase family protein [Coriobacteriia bacterium]